jgi:hypothetical protein
VQWENCKKAKKSLVWYLDTAIGLTANENQNQMPKTNGEVLTRGKKLNDLIGRHFFKLNKREKYLDWLAKEQPATYCALVARTMPAQAKIEITSTIDLGAAMLEAMQRLQSYGGDHMIDVTPDKVAEGVAENLPIEAKPLKANET